MIGPFLENILPNPPVPGQRFRLLEFPSTVRIVHEISYCRNAIVAEFAKPPEPQKASWWRNRIALETEEYLRSYGRVK
jgi:hypothetical protein